MQLNANARKAGQLREIVALVIVQLAHLKVAILVVLDIKEVNQNKNVEW